jgi:hypothetical protein
LIKLVAIHGLKSWVKVSVELGNRSDIQCRYQYLQIQTRLGKHPICEKARDEEVAEEKEELDGLVKEPEVVKEPGNGMSEKIGEDPLKIETLTLEFSGRSMSEIFWLQHS